ncbi:MAG: 2-C-methyl-D-erythritol 2,4-cyclodiphosphate synthase [Actinobacteria bacterium]|nr:2-C-methyl-D-erythritol 2,4-cyclodiphosphate synthase [Actinomycetota bacterium]
MRFGLGFDSHAADRARPLFLGGVLFEGEPGLAGHSDAVVVCHALADAMLGAAAIGDLGEHFPDTDPTIGGIGGLELLGRAKALLVRHGYRVRSCDLTVVAERPAVGPRRDEIRRNLARVLGLPIGGVSVKATRPEGLGLAGDGAACFALAVLART